MEKVRGFEIAKGFENAGINLPVRKTKYSAGYDFYSPVDVTIMPGESELIWTNVKAMFNENEVLMLFVRSGMGKSHIMIANGTGIIESDYYSNVSNDGFGASKYLSTVRCPSSGLNSLA